MKNSALLLMLIFVLTTSSIYVQESTAQYQLNFPTLKEYLAAVPSIMRVGNQEPLSQYAVFNYSLFDAITSEIYAKPCVPQWMKQLQLQSIVKK